MTARSYLYVPGDQPEKLAKAQTRGADALIADLEDAVSFSEKAPARRVVADWLADAEPGSAEIWVRINNAVGLLEEDLRACIGPRVTGVFLPKANDREIVAQVSSLLDDLEAGAEVAAGTIQLVPIVETARGLLAAPELAACPRTARLALGEVDLSAELGISASPDERELLPARMELVTVAAAVGVDPPVGPVFLDFADSAALRRSTMALRRMGYLSRQVIHPAQVAIVHEIFTPQPDEVAEAVRLVELFDASLAAGQGVCVDDDGSMVDEAVVRTARRTLAIAESAARLPD